MDIATLVGFIGGVVIILGAILVGGSLGMFIDVPSLLIVIGGTLMTTLIKIPLSSFIGSFAVGMKAVMTKAPDVNALIEEAVELADIARKNGLLALEGKEISNDFLKKGLGLCIDGHDPTVVAKLLGQDIANAETRHAKGAELFVSIGDMAPAMAVALLTTLYGAFIQNVFAAPIASKLTYRSYEESLAQNMICEEIGAINEVP